MFFRGVPSDLFQALSTALYSGGVKRFSIDPDIPLLRIFDMAKKHTKKKKQAVIGKGENNCFSGVGALYCVFSGENMRWGDGFLQNILGGRSYLLIFFFHPRARVCGCVWLFVCLFVCVCHGLKRKKKLKIEDKLFPSPYYFSGENSDGVMNSKFLHIVLLFWCRRW